MAVGPLGPCLAVGQYTITSWDNGQQAFTTIFNVTRDPNNSPLAIIQPSPTDSPSSMSTPVVPLSGTYSTTASVPFSANVFGSNSTTVTWATTLYYVTAGNFAFLFDDTQNGFTTTSGTNSGNTNYVTYSATDSSNRPNQTEGGLGEVTATATFGTGTNGVGEVEDCENFLVTGVDRSTIGTSTITNYLTMDYADYLNNLSSSYIDADSCSTNPLNGQSCTSDLMTGIAAAESMHQQFTTNANNSPLTFNFTAAGTDIPPDTNIFPYSVTNYVATTEFWPILPSLGSSHVGLFQYGIPNTLSFSDAWNWQTNADDGINGVYIGGMKRAINAMLYAMNGGDGVPQYFGLGSTTLTYTQLEDNASVFYRV